ncbi:hypothetical protein Taro_006402 [Colocasia esculenta]|uniref:Uncharacterized protein n=1 Tax=Colocasia esculenta TaxID=4460 RepID=A0A843TR23_COLES|nr:hypothetical protein [Colocasia esculenta]
MLHQGGGKRAAARATVPMPICHRAALPPPPPGLLQLYAPPHMHHILRIFDIH